MQANRLAFVFAMLLGGCAASDTDRVFTADDASIGDDAGTEDVGTSPDSGSTDSSRDAFVDRDAGGTDAGGTELCRPNGDGRIEGFEVPVMVGLNAKFSVAENASVDLVGTAWDFSAAQTGDRLEVIELLPADGWYAGDFPTADYAARLSSRSDLLGVFQRNENELLLLGVVSPQDGISRTNLEYDPPVTVFQFPLEAGGSWVTETTVTGIFEGVPGFWNETYTYTVDREGSVETPFANFDVLRIRVELERVVGLLTTTLRSYYFLTECFGTVAQVVSADNEQEVDFSTAAELWRLSF